MLQLGDPLGRQQIGTGGQDLAQLHPNRPQRFHRLSRASGQIEGQGVGITPRRIEPQPGEQDIKPEARRGRDDFGQSGAIPRRDANRPEHRHLKYRAVGCSRRG